MTATFCLATFCLATNEADAQWNRPLGLANAYYNGSNWNYNNAYGAYGAGGYGYTGYGNGPYGYRPSALSVYPSSGNYYYQSGTTYGLYYPGVQYNGNAYRPIYNSTTARFYSPYYGYRGY